MSHPKFQSYAPDALRASERKNNMNLQYAQGCSAEDHKSHVHYERSGDGHKSKLHYGQNGDGRKSKLHYEQNGDGHKSKLHYERSGDGHKNKLHYEQNGDGHKNKLHYERSGDDRKNMSLRYGRGYSADVPCEDEMGRSVAPLGEHRTPFHVSDGNASLKNEEMQSYVSPIVSFYFFARD